MTTVLVLNGPNLNLLGTRKPEVYGHTTLADVEAMCREEGGKLGLDVEFRQSNHEGALIDWIHEYGAEVKAGRCIGAVLNPGAFTHTSVALHDAIEGASLPVIECHHLERAQAGGVPSPLVHLAGGGGHHRGVRGARLRTRDAGSAPPFGPGGLR